MAGESLAVLGSSETFTPPWWVGIISTAKYLGVAPWDLLARVESGETCWLSWADTHAGASGRAQGMASPKNKG